MSDRRHRMVWRRRGGFCRDAARVAGGVHHHVSDGHRDSIGEVRVGVERCVRCAPRHMAVGSYEHRAAAVDPRSRAYPQWGSGTSLPSAMTVSGTRGATRRAAARQGPLRRGQQGEAPVEQVERRQARSDPAMGCAPAGDAVIVAADHGRPVAQTELRSEAIEVLNISGCSDRHAASWPAGRRSTS